jgi:hypothetical protein
MNLLLAPESNSTADAERNSRTLTSLETPHELTDRKNFGFSHKQCKILAPYLTYYKPESSDVPARYARIQSHEIYVEEHPGLPNEHGFFDCGRDSALSTCAFSVEPEDVLLPGIGMDSALKSSIGQSGYASMLDGLLKRISDIQLEKTGKRARQLVPLFVEADGNCLAHSLSRCLCGSQVTKRS